MKLYPTPEDVGRRLKKARHIAGLSQGDAADAAKIDRKTISRSECGCYYPKLEVLFALCDAYGVDATSILSAIEL